MQKRAFLLFVLLVVLTVFYISISGTNVPLITTEQKAQTEMLDNLDERVLEADDSDPESSNH